MMPLFLISFVLLMLSTPRVTAKAILGIDLGSLYMKVALVQRGAPLEIVTNLHSKRKTEQMILFDNGARFYGADASSLLARKPQLTPTGMTVMLGRDEEHPNNKALLERHFPVLAVYNETRHGVCLTVAGSSFTPEELVAMLLVHAQEITSHARAAHGIEGADLVRDVVLTVPSFATQHERRALLDAAALAHLNVLALIDETTAAALHFGTDMTPAQPGDSNSTDSTPEFPKIYVFFNMGATSTQVSVVRYDSYMHKDSKYAKEKPVVGFSVLSKAWDSTLGGQALDQVLVDYMTNQFDHQWNHARKTQDKTVIKFPRAMTKLRLQAQKVKHVLSANTEMPVYMENVYDDQSFSAHMTRKQLEDELGTKLWSRVTKPIEEALQRANITMRDVHGVELIGGGIRVPKVQGELQKIFGDDVELGMHLNGDEAMALGAAFYGANISTSFRVRHVGMTDLNPFPIGIRLEDLAVEETSGWFGKKKEEDPDEEGWSKSATMFKAFGKIGVKKTIAFTHDRDVHCAIDYEEEEGLLPKGTQSSLERYNITGVADFAKQMQEKGLEGKPKVSLQFELDPSGITRLIKAEAAMEELVMVPTEVEVDDDDDNATVTEGEEGEGEGEAASTEEAASEKEEEAATERKMKEEEEETAKADDADKEEWADKDDAAAEKNETEAEEEKNETDAEEEKNETEAPPKKKKKTIIVEKEKKIVHRQALEVLTYRVGKIRPYSPELLEESRNKLETLDRLDKERILLEEAKNKVESYIYHIRNKFADDEDADAIIAKVSTDEQRSDVRKLAEDAEEWLYDDGQDADLETLVAKYEELSNPAEAIFFRASENTKRPEAVLALHGHLGNISDKVENWTTTMPQITPEEREDVLKMVEEIKTWITEQEQAQAEKDPTEDPVFTSEEVTLKTKRVDSLVTKLSRKPKPKKKKPKSNETDAEGGGGDANETTAEDGDDKEEKEAAADEDAESKEEASGSDGGDSEDKDEAADKEEAQETTEGEAAGDDEL